MSKKTVFNNDWTNATLFPAFAAWIAPVLGNNHEAMCKFCIKKFGLSNMGQQSLISHMNGQKHKKNVGPVTNKQPSVGDFFKWKAETSKTTIINTTTSTSMAVSVVTDSQYVGVPVLESPIHDNEIIDLPNTENKRCGNMYDFITRDNVTRAEILWVFKTVMSHYSLNSSTGIKNMFQNMFPDSNIAKQFTMSPTKTAYVITHGLSPYFKQKLICDINECQDVVVCFDEALNKVIQCGQMDLLGRYWDNEMNQVSTRYITSVFLGHATANDLLKQFKAGLSDVDLHKILQISMDGPSVNWKFIRDLKSFLKTDGDPNSPELMDIGSCGLHVIHGALQTGHQASGWEVNETLSGMYRLFHDSPAREQDFATLCGTASPVFPKKFCKHRWCENSDVASRAIAVFPNIKKFMASSSAKKISNTISSTSVKKACSDSFTLCKLAFFAYISGILEPFLKRFQTARPMVPFLCESLYELVYDLMSCFIKEDVLSKGNTVVKLLKIIDVADKGNFLSPRKVHIGYAAKRFLSNVEASELRKLEFRSQCLSFLSATTAKILERCPLKYTFVRAVSCLSPNNLPKNRSSVEKRMDIVLEELHEAKRLDTSTADKAKKEFSKLCASLETDKEKAQMFQKFSINDDRLDTFYNDLLKEDSNSDCLWTVVKLILIMSHGNATVESGFSINKNMLVENLLEESVVARRHVYDAIHTAGGDIDKVVIDKNMLQSVRSASARYKEALNVKKKEQSEERKRKTQKRLNTVALKELKAKKAKIVSKAVEETRAMDDEIEKLKAIL